MLLSVAYWWYEPFPYPPSQTPFIKLFTIFACPIPFGHTVSSCSVSCSSLASRLHAKCAAMNFRGNLIPFLRAPTFAGCNYLLPSWLRPLSCWLTWHRHAHTHVYIYHIPVPPRSLAWATISSPALGTCRHCPLAQLFHLLQALPHFLPICQVLFPTLPLLVVCLQCLSGLAGPHFCYIEVPPVLSPLDTFIPLCGDAISVAWQPPVNAQPWHNCSVFVVSLSSPCLALLV